MRGNPRAHRVDDYKGKRMFCVPVSVRFNNSKTFESVRLDFEVIAPSAVDAANWMRERINYPDTEVCAYGPRGGEVSRFVGWFSAIGTALASCPRGPAVLALLF